MNLDEEKELIEGKGVDIRSLATLEISGAMQAQKAVDRALPPRTTLVLRTLGRLTRRLSKVSGGKKGQREVVRMRPKSKVLG